MTSMMSSALALAGLGWPVFPCVETGPRPKRPYIAHGFKAATTSPEQIRQWWTAWPGALIGLPVPATMVVVDLDPRDIPACADLIAAGASAFEVTCAGLCDLAVRIGGTDLADTLSVVSGRGDGGVHLYYRAPALPEGWAWRAHPVGLDGSELKGVDVRAGGLAYVIAPPSRHPATGRPYRWATSCPGTPADLPGSLWRALTRRPEQAPSRYRHRAGILAAGVSRTGSQASRLEGMVRKMAGAQPGERNSLLNVLAYVVAREFTNPEVAMRALGEAAQRAGLPEAEVRSTLASAWRGGTRASVEVAA